MRFVVEGHPVAAPRMTRGSRWNERTQRYMAYREQVAIAARQAGVAMMPGPCRVAARWYVKSSHRGDLDNLLKGLLDALNGIAWEDDRQVVRLDLEVLPVYERSVERVEVEVGPWPAEAAS